MRHLHQSRQCRIPSREETVSIEVVVVTRTDQQFHHITVGDKLLDRGDVGPRGHRPTRAIPVGEGELRRIGQAGIQCVVSTTAGRCESATGASPLHSEHHPGQCST